MESLSSLEIGGWVVIVSLVSYIMAPIVAAGVRAVRRAIFEVQTASVAPQSAGPADNQIHASASASASDNAKARDNTDASIDAHAHAIDDAAPPCAALRVRRNYRRPHSAVSYRHSQRRVACRP